MKSNVTLQQVTEAKGKLADDILLAIIAFIDKTGMEPFVSVTTVHNAGRNIKMNDKYPVGIRLEL
jgi:hypothetical protein